MFLKPGRSERGGALVECAIIFGLVFLLVFGIIQLAYIAYATALLDDAAQAAARAAVVELSDNKALAAAAFVLLPLRRMAYWPSGKEVKDYTLDYIKGILFGRNAADIKKFVSGLLPLTVDIKSVHAGRALDYDKHRRKHGPKKYEIPTVYAHVASPTSFRRCQKRKATGKCEQWHRKCTKRNKKGKCTKYKDIWYSCKDKKYGCANYRHWWKISGVDGKGNFYYWKTNAETPRYYPKLHTDVHGNLDWVTSGRPTTYARRGYSCGVLDLGCCHETVKCASNQGYDCTATKPKEVCVFYRYRHERHWVKIEDKMDILDPGKSRDINKDEGPLVVEATVTLKVKVIFPRVFASRDKNGNRLPYLLLTSACRMMKEDESW